ncbi:asparagine synthase (glutamine-hydrolyzing) [Magnetospira sp. QH-2]|uniref:asparagine synthase (glutamine-hydrolyzing) n=1 Tax=Magnetospira sp. (strain QH-2) TaxID=1288970 RepID=UPI0003E816B0|nr:asparagine synthase (glutamine-hydrolyzing) [Magnetospira sp. QH-2]CCQ73071.1 Asparagine synthase, glutamine-hydrolyzing [Magnetospira sp. QH-2]
MCGLAGIISDEPVSPGVLSMTLAALQHRGPDGNGAIQSAFSQRHLALLHTRLAIIDPDDRAAQPFRRAGLNLVYNGEIYNYIELRRELEALGHRFTTRSDTEVILEAYRAWGADCVKRFDGMWALALHDEERGILWLSRDRFGEKPLYWMRQGRTLVFGSEVRALFTLSGHRPEPDRDRLRAYLVNGYKSLFKRSDSWFEGVYALPPGHSAVVDASARVEPTRYWTLTHAPRTLSLGDLVEGTREKLIDGVTRRLRADVPLAFCLSGGIDSGTIAALAAKYGNTPIHAFSIVDRDPRYDERDTMMETVKSIGCRHTVIAPGTSGFIERLAAQIESRDAPVSTISYYVHGFLSEAIAGAGYKVALSGTGADELFTGYYDHYNFWLAGMKDRDDFPALLADWRSGYGRMVRNPILKDPHVIIGDPGCRRHIYLDNHVYNRFMRDPIAETFTETAFCTDGLRNRMMNELFEEVVPVILEEDDRNSMGVSIENRSPFLDHRLAEFAYSIPGEYLVQDGFLKWVLRAAGEGVLPDAVRLDRRKRGFNAAIDTMLDRSDPTVRERLLSDGPIFDLVNRALFTNFLDQDMSDADRSKFLFRFLSTRLFLDHLEGAA